MLNYVPERIYEVLKDEPRFNELTEIITDRFSKVGTLLDVVMFDTNAKADKEIYNYYVNTLTELVNEKCPEYALQLHVTLMQSDKDELLGYYDDRKKYDEETTMYLLSYLINCSYDDYTFPQFQKTYVETYESTPVEIRNNFSDYIHLKYINSKVERYAMYEAPRDATFIIKVVDLLKRLYENFKSIVHEPNILKYCFIEILDHSLTNAFKFVNNDKLIYDAVQQLEIPEEFEDGDFKGTSINELGILDKKFELAVAARKWVDAIHKYNDVLDWIEMALLHPEKLYRTLIIYDKVMAPNFCAILRRYLRLSDEFFNRAGERQININPQDKEFILKPNYEGLEVSNLETTLSFNRLTKHMDDWFTNNGISLYAFRAWYYNIYKNGLSEAYVQLSEDEPKDNK